MTLEYPAPECTEGRSCTGLIPPLGPVEAGFNRFTEICMLIAAVMIGALVVPICFDIICRNFFGFAIDGMMEVEVLVLVAVAFGCMGYTIVTRSPIQIDLFYLWMRGKTQARLDLFSNLLCLAISAVLAYFIFWETVEWTALTTVLRIPEKYAVGCTCLAFATIAVAMLFQIRHSLRELCAMKDYVGILIAFAAVIALCGLPFAYRASGFKFSGLALGATAFAVLMALLMIRVPIGLAMALIGLLGLFALLRRPEMAFKAVAPVPFRYTADFIFVAMPMFMFMGELTFYSGLSKDLFDCANKWMGRLPGGLAIASVGGCAGFGAVCGDSLACVITMSSVALPAMRAQKYDEAMACGALAAGGTLGILIPPSMGFIFYSIITEESIGKLFIAGILPGILLSAIFMAIIYIKCVRHPELAPKAADYPLKDKLISTLYLVPVGLLFVLVVGGIMMGVFTPGEGGAVGAMGAFIYALVRRRLTLANLMAGMRSTAIMTGKIFLIFAGVYILGQFLASSRLPNLMADAILGLDINRYAVLGVVCLLYIVLGCVMNILPMMMLTLPSIYPTIMALGFDGIWFGVVTVILMEMGMITPPVGMNVFTLSSLVPDIPMSTIFKGVIPFFFGMILCTIIITIFPQIALVLPNAM